MKFVRTTLPLTCLLVAGLCPASGQDSKLASDLQALLANPLGSAADNSWSASTSDRRTLFGSIGSAYIGVLSSLMGIGGGIIHVPFLIRILRIPAHIATATSHFVLTFVALTATVTHFAMGEFNHGLAPTMYLAVGVMMGAPAGAVISTRIQGSLIVRLLAVALCLVGLRLLARLFLCLLSQKCSGVNDGQLAFGPGALNSARGERLPRACGSGGNPRVFRGFPPLP